jgi:hypothetical protein
MPTVVLRDVFGQELKPSDIGIQVNRVNDYLSIAPVGSSGNPAYRAPLIRANPGDDVRFKVVRDGTAEIIKRP